MNYKSLVTRESAYLRQAILHFLQNSNLKAFLFLMNFEQTGQFRFISLTIRDRALGILRPKNFWVKWSLPCPLFHTFYGIMPGLSLETYISNLSLSLSKLGLFALLQTPTSRINSKWNTLKFWPELGGVSKKRLSAYKSSSISETWQLAIKRGATVSIEV